MGTNISLYTCIAGTHLSFGRTKQFQLLYLALYFGFMVVLYIVGTH